MTIKGNRIDRLLVGITGSSGVILGIHLLQLLQQTEVHTDLIISHAANMAITRETGWKTCDIHELAHDIHDFGNIDSSITSEPFLFDGMVIAPCSIKTLSSIANGYRDNLLTKSAVITLDEGKPLALVVRERPLLPAHLQIMQLAAEAGAIIYPPIPDFDQSSQTMEEILSHIGSRILSVIGI